MASSITLGIKVDLAFRDRLRGTAERLGCTPHWLHKQALLAYLDAIERGHVPSELMHLQDAEAVVEGAADDEGLLPFHAFAQDIQPQSVLRSAITAAYRRPEVECLPFLLQQAQPAQSAKAQELAEKLVLGLRNRRGGGGVESLIQEFSLSSQEGVALMCLAEALLRIPDRPTRDALIRDKVSHGDWRAHVGESTSLFVNAASWGLMLTGKLVSSNSEKSLSSALTRLISKGGEPLIRRGVDTAMRLMGEQFVTGETISSALSNSRKMEEKGFRYSYDMLGEAATTSADAQRYYQAYEQAVHAIGKASQGKGIYEGGGISIKLSALHPRYSRAQRDRVMDELYPRLLSLCVLARRYDIGLNIDAEEADRLELSLDLLERLCFEPDLAAWNGIGFVVQTYQKRAPYVIDYLIDLAKRSSHRLMIRLVKGAYWDSEIKRAQLDGLEDYPVYTRKVHTDVAYLACARKMLQAPEALFPQFATHNAQTLSAIYYMAGQNYYPGQYEFQCLHGMGEPLYEQVVGPLKEGKLNRPCRIYAPVGPHETLLAYLVRRLLENGANTSFVNQIGDKSIPVESLIRDPISQALQIQPVGKPHDKIPLPRQLYWEAEERLNSAGLDLSNEHRLGSLAAALLHGCRQPVRALPLLGQDSPEWDQQRAQTVLNPANHQDVVGHVMTASALDIEHALSAARHYAPIWESTPVHERADSLLRAAQMLEDRMQELMGVLVREAGKSYANAIAEVREAVDFLRYYATQVRRDLQDVQARPLGCVVCISPWNFPLAIFLGQISAALAAGNVVLAKPAEQTPLIASLAVGILHQAGIPAGALQLLPGDGVQVGAPLVSHALVNGVMFTGSTEVARLIAQQLSQRLNPNGQVVPLVAETGGLNAMVVDSSALAEQVVVDVLNSAFDSAGQRCSALRLLCLQADCADRVLDMLKGAMHELRVGRPDMLTTDVGPVIDAEAKRGILEHIVSMKAAGHTVEQVAMPALSGTFVAPTLIEISRIDELEREVFGPVLHVIRYERKDQDLLIERINERGYGLTFGVHTRIDETIDRLTQKIRAGNVYVNRNIVGAVVGVQPFGGEGLSGTGPKAGGPLYVRRLLTDVPKISLAPYRQQACALPGPTGESNRYQLHPRGTVLCIPATELGLQQQLETVADSGNQALVYVRDAQSAYARLAQEQGLSMVSLEAELDSFNYEAVLFEGDSDELLVWNQRLAQSTGPIIGLQGLSSASLQAGAYYQAERLVREVSTSVNTAAVGGNASLMMIG